MNIMTDMFKKMHYCLQMYLKILEVSVLKYIKLILLIFFCGWIIIASLLKKETNKTRIITDIDMV